MAKYGMPLPSDPKERAGVIKNMVSDSDDTDTGDFHRIEIEKASNGVIVHRHHPQKNDKYKDPTRTVHKTLDEALDHIRGCK